MADKAPLRVALLLDSLMQPAWVRTMLEELTTTAAAEIVLVVTNDHPPTARRSISDRLAGYRRNFLYLAYTRLDEWRFRASDDPFTESDVSDLLGGATTMSVSPKRTRFCDYFDDSDVERIRSYDIDVAVRLGFRILKGKALQIARFGVWSYHHADNTVNRGGPPAFWEVAECAPVTGAVLQILSEELDNGRVIYRSYSATERYSVTKNLHGLYWKSATFVPRKLRDLHEIDASALADPAADACEAYSRGLYKSPTNREMLGVLARLAGRYTREKLRALVTRDQWFLAYKFRSPSTMPDVPDRTFYNFNVLAPPVDRFWADPFPIVRDGRHYIFYEEFPFATGKGHISVFSIDRNGQVGSPCVALATDHHLSYPNVFEWQDALYMLPEAADSGRVQLYRCEDFPTAWEPVGKPLEDTPGADPTVAHIGDRWWLFLTLAPRGTGSWNDELHLYFAESPLGPWQPHRRNPVKSDVRSSRPAGRIFSRGGQLYRPAQDCSVRYGYGMSIQRIVRIDEAGYAEQPVASIRPEWWPGLRAAHTLNAAGDLTVIDGQWGAESDPPSATAWPGARRKGRPPDAAVAPRLSGCEFSLYRLSFHPTTSLAPFGSEKRRSTWRASATTCA